MALTLPVRPLTVLQNWDCQGCSNCCRTYHVRVNHEEKQRIFDQNWTAEINHVNPVVYDAKLGSDRLNHDEDGKCIFLGENNRCRIHDQFGSAGKPLACRLFPFFLIPVGDHWRVGMRFACPTVIENQGKPIAEHASDLKEYAQLYQAELNRDLTAEPAPELQPGQATTWPDLHRFVAACSDFLKPAEIPFETRLRRVLAFAQFMRKSRFEKVSGPRLSEFLELISATIEEDTPKNPAQITKPGFVGRSLFRQVAAVYSRKDVGMDHGDLVKRGAFGRMTAAWRFALGKGNVPTVHKAIPPTALFSHAEQKATTLTSNSQELLTRYFRTKIESLQFCGRANFNLTVWDGLEALLLTFPVMIWLSRIIGCDSTNNEQEKALKTAMRIVDDNFGFNPLLGAFKQKVILHSIRTKDELPKLIAWYGQ